MYSSPVLPSRIAEVQRHNQETGTDTLREPHSGLNRFTCACVCDVVPVYMFHFMQLNYVCRFL